MSPDPMQKNRASVSFGDGIPKSQGPGSINTSKDYSAIFTSLGSRIVFLSTCILPYIGICAFVYLEGLEVLAIILLTIPLVLFSLFWFLKKKLDT